MLALVCFCKMRSLAVAIVAGAAAAAESRVEPFEIVAQSNVERNFDRRAERSSKGVVSLQLRRRRSVSIARRFKNAHSGRSLLLTCVTVTAAAVLH